MKSLLFYSAFLLLIEYGLGFGLAKKLLPQKLKEYALIMAPWVLNIFVILVMVIGSLLGVPGKYLAGGLMTGLLFLTFLERKGLKITRSTLMLIGVVILCLVLSNSPLVLRDKFLTTISLGNNDVIAYASNADYLVENSIRDNFRQSVILPVANLLQDGYRWGTPLLSTFFLSLTGTEAWRLTYLVQTIVFATMLPLGYVLYKLWYGKSGYLALIVPILIGFNANLLYMLYHNFFGQVVFWGVELVLAILATVYFLKPEKKLEWLIGGGVAAMYMSYHEPALFVLVPLSLGAIFTKNWQGLLRIAGISAIIGGISIMNATIFDFGQAFRGNPDQPIGWQIFRSESPLANPFEVLGLSSVHTAPPLSYTLAWGLSLLVVVITTLGALRSKISKYTLSLISFFALMFLWTSLGKTGNWFVFNRAYTYVLPILLVMFVGGIAQHKQKWGRGVLAVVIVILVILQGARLSKKFVNSHLSVHAWYQTLEEVRREYLLEPLYTTGMISPYLSIWDQVWIGYFLYPPIDQGTIPKTPVSDGNLVLSPKSNPWVRYPSYAFAQVVWENDYYQLGRWCDKNCLYIYPGEIHEVVFGQSSFEDSLLGLGWSNPERGGRWIEGKEASLLLRADHSVNRIIIEAQSLAEGTITKVYTDGKIIGEIELSSERKVHEIKLSLTEGMHEIKLMSDRSASPRELGLGEDLRKLSVRVSKVSLSP